MNALSKHALCLGLLASAAVFIVLRFQEIKVACRVLSPAGEGIRDILSLVVLYVPMIAVATVLYRRYRQNGRTLFIAIGPGFIVGGICAYIGVKYFDLVVIGRGRVAEGSDAVECALKLMATGIIMTGLHFALNRLFPNWMLRRKKNG